MTREEDIDYKDFGSKFKHNLIKDGSVIRKIQEDGVKHPEVDITDSG